MLVIVPGTKKLRQRAIRKLLRDELEITALDSRLATREEVKSITGFDVGGVPPISLSSSMQSLIDQDVHLETIVFGGGGSNNTILEIPTKTLMTLTRPITGNICSPL